MFAAYYSVFTMCLPMVASAFQMQARTTMTSEIPEIMKSMMSSGPKSPRVARNPSRLTMKTAMPKPAITLAMICCLLKDTDAGT